MKREMDLIRTILLHCEEHLLPGNKVEITEEGFEGYEIATLREHVNLMVDQNWLEVSSFKNALFVRRMTFEAYDFLDSVRDPEIWQQTKDGAKAAGGFTLDLLKSLAKGYLQKKIKDHTGVDI